VNVCGFAADADNAATIVPKIIALPYAAHFDERDLMQYSLEVSYTNDI